MNNNIQNVTPINMLPDLEDLETNLPPQQPSDNLYHSQQNILSPEQMDKYKKAIRTPHQVPKEAGMTSESYYHYGGYEEPYSENKITTYNMPENTPSCLEVAEHIVNCPICSQLYKNDRTIYIVIIVILTIVCLLLLKKILNL